VPVYRDEIEARDLALALETGGSVAQLDMLRGGRAIVCTVEFEHPSVESVVG
jgi:hypothetical protein